MKRSLVPAFQPRRPAWRPWLLVALVLLVVGALLATASFAWFARRAEPLYAGTLVLPGLAAPVRVAYGPHAVPSIQAASVDDLLFAQGYLVAAERLWQMDLLRRLAGGRLAEVFGPAALGTDRYFRTIGLPRAAAAALAALEPEYRRLLERYADGVNAYRAQATRRLPLEYVLSGVRPAPWRAADSLVIGEYMAWINAMNLREELVFLRLANRLGTPAALELFPTDQGLPAPADARDLPDYRNLLGSAPAAPAAALMSPAAASNAWAVTGERTADGGALLANDPHLLPAMPMVWYELELQAPGLHVAGVALAGVPLVLIGHNADLAWGITASAADVQDLFLERATPDGRGVQRPSGAVAPIDEREERIAVAGGEPERLVIRSTSHGVLVDELLAAPETNPEGLPALALPPGLHVALRTVLDAPERAIVAFWRLNTATDIAAARAATADLLHAPLNLLIVDREGHIAWQMSGRYPVRGRGSGAFPAPAWEAGYGWHGLTPAASNPGQVDPSSQRLISANQRMLPPAAAARLGHGWLPPFRAQRITELLDAAATGPLLTADDLQRMQRDRNSPQARLYLDSLRRHLPEIARSDPAAARIAAEFLLDWDGDCADHSRPAAFFALLRPALYQALYGEALGPELWLLMSLAPLSYGPLEEALASDVSSFWPGRPDGAGGPAAVWARALHATAAAFADRLPHRRDQRLDRLRRLTFRHAFDGQPLLGPLFNVGPIGRGGDSGTIDVANASPNWPREVGSIPAVRVVFVPGDWGATRGSLPLGQSGHRFSPYRRDQLDDWLAGVSHAWPWNGPAGDLIGTLRLLPAPAAAD
ncbi:MAG: penicillin acylase family protein [Chromatiaceae bacterium]|nr:MAG: penicillin acylase family protein [Chromatiaceae bacterium]